MEKSQINDKRSVKLDHVMSKDFIPFMTGRPLRNNVIDKEDIVNLSIALNTTADVNDFLMAL
ncbi:MAG: hypothetical protein JNL74_02930 [Fibrobacteres bacterium]|nr:hypothetical protein [Fibrobacterota bacterium]